MSLRTGTAVLLVAWLGSACDEPTPSGVAGSRLVDLSHAFDADTIFWPTETGFVLEPGPAGETEAGYWYAANRFRTAEHGGTHLDAPIHFSASGRGVDAIPLQDLVGPGIVVDVREATAADRDLAVGVGAFTAWETRHGAIPDGAIVLIRTGVGAAWPDRQAVLGTARRGAEAVAELHFPGLHADAARWLVGRDIRAVGIDTPSIDPGPSQDFAAHRVLAAAQIPVFENVARLEQLPPRAFEVVALPMKIRGGTGAPLRIVAIVP